MRPPARRGIRGAVAIVALVVVLLLVIDGLTPSSSGPPSSSYTTAPSGLEAYADLLSRAGHKVTRLRVMPSRARLDPRQTLVLLDPNLLLPRDVAALRSFVLAGGRLLAGGREPGAWLSRLMADPPVWSSAGATEFEPLTPVSETTGVGSVSAASGGSWSDPRGTLPAVGAPEPVLLTVAALGAGRVALLADSSPLQNQLLAEGDNAAFALALAGPPARPVAFEEAVHGYGETGGLSGLPARWKWALIGLLAAALAWVASRIRRLGPPQPAQTPAPPARRAHVDALGAALARTGSRGTAAEPVRDHARRLVLQRARLPDDADARAVSEAGLRLGLDPEESEVIGAAVSSEEGAMAAGRALSKLMGEPA